MGATAGGERGRAHVFRVPRLVLVLVSLLPSLLASLPGAASAATAAGTTVAAAPATLAAHPAPPSASGLRHETELRVSGQLRAFGRRGPLGEERLQPSLAATLEHRSSWNDGADRVTVAPFLRIDALDDRRSRGDLREAYYSHFGEGFELHAGLRRLFWGVTESKHLVDVVNQVDLVEAFDEEARLGQPMVHLLLHRDAGTLELLWLPTGRPRTFPGPEGRLRGPVLVEADPDRPGDRGLEQGWAVRFSGFAGSLDYALAHFSGPARDPLFELAAPPQAGRPVRLRAVAELLDRTSLEAQYLLADTALKLELVHRSGQGPRSTAFVAGLEHTIVGAFGTRADLGLLVEYLFDDREDDAPILAFEHDVFAGVRLALNDLADSSLLAGAIVDHRSGETIVSVEASRRLGAHWRLDLELLTFSGSRTPALGDAAALTDPRAKYGIFADEDHLQLELTRFF